MFIESRVGGFLKKCYGFCGYGGLCVFLQIRGRSVHTPLPTPREEQPLFEWFKIDTDIQRVLRLSGRLHLFWHFLEAPFET
jgi:hypothetical protein